MSEVGLAQHINILSSADGIIKGSGSYKIVPPSNCDSQVEHVPILQLLGGAIPSDSAKSRILLISEFHRVSIPEPENSTVI